MAGSELHILLLLAHCRPHIPKFHHLHTISEAFLRLGMNSGGAGQDVIYFCPGLRIDVLATVKTFPACGRQPGQFTEDLPKVTGVIESALASDFG